MNNKLFLYLGIAAFTLFATILLMIGWGYFNQPARSPYVAQQESPVRGLSSQEIDDLLNGRGAGYARTADLNNYPGPRHALDLQRQLNLSSEQTTQIQLVFERMQAQAKEIGQKIVHREGQFSAAFANGTISETELKSQTEDLALLYGQLRAVHLQAHLQIKPLLSTEQIAEYNTLRGYNDSSNQRPAGQHQGQSH